MVRSIAPFHTIVEVYPSNQMFCGMEKPFINLLSIFFLLGLSLPSEGSPAPAADLTAQWSASPGSPLQIVHSLKSPGYRHRFSKEEVKSEPLPLEEAVTPLVEAHCIECHDWATETPLDFESLGYDLNDPATFRQWEHVFDRAKSGEMPPKKKKRPDPRLLQTALDSLYHHLLETNLSVQRDKGRVPSRRLTPTEYQYTLMDLLQISEGLGHFLPAESDSGGFDTVGREQRFSDIHIRSYLDAADRALDFAINLDPRPNQGKREFDYYNSSYVNRWFTVDVSSGGQNILKLDDAVGLIVELDYLMMSDRAGFQIHQPGLYRITAEAYAFRATTPVVLKIIRGGSDRTGIDLISAVDIFPGETNTLDFTTYLKPGDYLNPMPGDVDSEDGLGRYGISTLGKGTVIPLEDYHGEGVALKSIHVEGPLVETWPPPSTRRLLTGVQFLEGENGYEVQLSKEPIEHVKDIVARLAPLAFLRPAKPSEIEAFVNLAKPALEDGRDFLDALRLPLRALLSSPQFMFHSGEPGELDDYALATRLSYFLWRSMPDQELFDLAKKKRLSNSRVLASQVERMLQDEKSERFVEDFVGQWLRLKEIDATTPDKLLYPEYKDTLRLAMLDETRLFFKEMIDEDLGVANFIESDFTFLNRPLAEHYQIPGVGGQDMRKVKIPEGNPRGGVLTHASILKVTANGTITSPVPRGNFVLNNLLGKPVPPPPPVDAIEPDTRGATTIREILAKHRDVASCNQCHKRIDPPGFALESFNPIGGFRSVYRITDESIDTPNVFFGVTRGFYGEGLPVDASGVTEDGKPFTGIHEFKQHLLAHEDQVARHFISQLIVFATGGEIEFADRDEVARILEKTRRDDYGIRSIIHEVAQSRLFKHK